MTDHPAHLESLTIPAVILSDKVICSLLTTLTERSSYDPQSNPHHRH